MLKSSCSGSTKKDNSKRLRKATQDEKIISQETFWQTGQIVCPKVACPSARALTQITLMTQARCHLTSSRCMAGPSIEVRLPASMEDSSAAICKWIVLASQITGMIIRAQCRNQEPTLTKLEQHLLISKWLAMLAILKARWVRSRSPQIPRWCRHRIQDRLRPIRMLKTI